MTYMNESGRAVRSLLDYFRLAPGDVLVIHDDIDLPFGRLRLQVGGGSGGNNGVRSIESSLGTKDFSRLMLGVGRPPGRMDASMPLPVAKACPVVPRRSCDTIARATPSTP